MKLNLRTQWKNFNQKFLNGNHKVARANAALPTTKTWVIYEIKRDDYLDPDYKISQLDCMCFGKSLVAQI